MEVDPISRPHRAPGWLVDGVSRALRSYQWDWLQRGYDERGEPVDLAHRGARQIGKDHAHALEAALDMALRPRRAWSILSASLSHSKDFLGDVSTHLDYLADLHALNGVAFPRKVRDSAELLELSNGSTFRAYAATAKNAQGRRGNIILNELGIMPGAELIFETAEAVVRGQRTAGLPAAMRIIGNASVQGSFFHRWWTSASSSSFVRITSPWRAVIERWLVEDLSYPLTSARRWIESQVEEITRRLGASAFGQWYACQWRAPSEGFFPASLLERQSYDPSAPPSDFPALHRRDVRQGVGWDPSRRQHPAGFCSCLEGDGDNPRHFLHGPKRYLKTPWYIQEAELDRRINERHTVKVAIDRQGIGDKPAEDAQDRWGDALIYGYPFSPDKRMALLNYALDSFERGVLLLPLDTDLRMEFEAIQRVYRKDGKESAHIPETTDSHGDMAVAGMLAAWALANPGAAIFGGWT